MNAFGIYMIILSVAYVLYYVTIITIDWNKKEPTTQSMEIVDVDGVVDSLEEEEQETVDEEGDLQNEEDVEELSPLQDGQVQIVEEGTNSRGAYSSEQEESNEEETPIENDDPIEKNGEVDSDVEEPERVEESAHPEGQIEEVPTVVPVSSAMEVISEGGSSDEDDFDPFGYEPEETPYSVVSVIGKPKERTEADDKADSVNDGLEETTVKSFDDLEGSELDKLLSDEMDLNEKKIMYRHEFESL